MQSLFILTANSIRQLHIHRECLCPLSRRSPSITADLTIMWTSETHESLRCWSWPTEIQWRPPCDHVFLLSPSCQSRGSGGLSPNIWATSKQHPSPTTTTFPWVTPAVVIASWRYHLVLSLPSKICTERYRDPADGDKSERLYSECGNSSSSSAGNDEISDLELCIESMQILFLEMNIIGINLLFSVRNFRNTAIAELTGRSSCNKKKDQFVTSRNTDTWACGWDEIM